jgi:hypothetical protein
VRLHPHHLQRVQFPSLDTERVVECARCVREIEAPECSYSCLVCMFDLCTKCFVSEGGVDTHPLPWEAPPAKRIKLENLQSVEFVEDLKEYECAVCLSAAPNPVTLPSCRQLDTNGISLRKLATADVDVVVCCSALRPSLLLELRRRFKMLSDVSHRLRSGDAPSLPLRRASDRAEVSSLSESEGGLQLDGQDGSKRAGSDGAPSVVRASHLQLPSLPALDPRGGCVEAREGGLSRARWRGGGATMRSQAKARGHRT